MENQNDKTLLDKYTSVAKKIIYNPERAKALANLLDSGPDGAVSAVQTVLAGIERLKPIPPELKPMLAVNTFTAIVELAQDVTGQELPKEVFLKEMMMVVKAVSAPGQAAPAQQEPQGMLAQMQEQGEPAGDPTTPDNTPAHENAEPPALEAQEGAEEDPQAGMLAQMQRRGVPA